MTKNKYLLTSKNQHFIANHSIRDDVLKRYGEIIRNENKPEDNCPFDICCDDKGEVRLYSKEYGGEIND